MSLQAIKLITSSFCGMNQVLILGVFSFIRFDILPKLDRVIREAVSRHALLANDEDIVNNI